MSYPGKWNSLRGKRSRISLVNGLISDAGGHIKLGDLKKKLTAQGYPNLHEKLLAMGFDVVNGHVQGHVHG